MWSKEEKDSLYLAESHDASVCLKAVIICHEHCGILHSLSPFLLPLLAPPLPTGKQFLNFTTILARPIRGADNGMFNTTGKGDLLIFLPNGGTHSHIILKDVLYTPTMGFTVE